MHQSHQTAGRVRGASTWYPNPLVSLGQNKESHPARLKEIMRRDLATIRPDSSVAEAANQIVRTPIGCLAVEKDRSLVGILTARDLARCVGEGHGPETCPVSGHMSTPVVTATLRMNVLDASHLMIEKGVRWIPIVDAGRPIGVVSVLDVMSVVYHSVETDRPRNGQSST